MHVASPRTVPSMPKAAVPWHSALPRWKPWKSYFERMYAFHPTNALLFLLPQTRQRKRDLAAIVPVPAPGKH